MFVQEGVDSEKNDFADFRSQALELARDFEPCLKAPTVMMQVTIVNLTFHYTYTVFQKIKIHKVYAPQFCKYVTESCGF